MQAQCFEVMEVAGRRIFNFSMAFYLFIFVFCWSDLFGPEFGYHLHKIATRIDTVLAHPCLTYDGPLDPVQLYNFARFCALYEYLAAFGAVLWVGGRLARDLTSFVRDRKGVPAPALNQIFLLLVLVVVIPLALFAVLRIVIAGGTVHVDRLISLLGAGWLFGAMPSTTVLMGSMVVSIVAYRVSLIRRRA